MAENNVLPAGLDKAFAALSTYNLGSGRGALMPIDEAVVAATSNGGARQELKRRLVAVLQSQAPSVAKEYVCRKLAVIGSAESVPALAALLGQPELVHMARVALEAITVPEAGRALRGGLSRLAGLDKAGVIQSLGMRRDAESVPALAALLTDSDARVAGAAAAALGNIGNAPAAQALQQFQPKAPEAVRNIVANALLACAEALAGGGKKTEAQAIYKALAGSEQPKHVKLAATRGMLLGTQK